MSERWLCVYTAHTGSTARAVFATRDQATQFVTRHAQSAAPSGLPLKWEDAGGSTVLRTPLGDYLITMVDIDSSEQRPHQPSAA